MWQAGHLVLSPFSILRPEDHWQLRSQVVAVTAVVQLLDLAAPAEVGAMHAKGHLMAQSARNDLHAAHHALRKPLAAAATSSHCQMTARHGGRAAPWRWQHGQVATAGAVGTSLHSPCG